MQRFNSKRITDPIHKTIGLSELEVDVIGTRAFQRLRNVKQLGLANLVFPGADYSRFSHSLGVCHVTGRTLESLRDNGVSIEDDEVQTYRLAALLHDIGHYPYSHTAEDAIADHYSSRLIEGGVGAAEETLDGLPAYYKHESVGKEVLTRDPELLTVFNRYGIEPADIYSIFTREETSLRFTNLVSSDLDADRIDYLLRTAHHAGLPYGSVDLDYLLSQMRLDNEGRICVTAKALRTVDHFLLSRYFDYQQVPFHKTVAALELVLKDVLVALLERGLLKGSASDVVQAIQNGDWYQYDDTSVMQRIRDLAGQAETEVLGAKAKAILERTPPKLLAAVERVRHRDTATADDFRGQKQHVKRQLAEWAEKFGIDEDLWYVWEPKGTTLTKIGSHIPSSTLIQDPAKEIENLVQTVHVLDEATNTSAPITSYERSLMSILANYEVYPLRIYALLPDDAQDKIEKVKREIRTDLPYIKWI